MREQMKNEKVSEETKKPRTRQYSSAQLTARKNKWDNKSVRIKKTKRPFKKKNAYKQIVMQWIQINVL